MNRIAITTLSMLFASPLLNAQEDKAVSQAHFASNLFFRACVASLGRSSLVEATARNLGLVEQASGASEKDLISGKGKVWDASNTEGKFYLQLDSSGLCSVRANKANASALKEAFLELLPPSSPGWEVKKTIEATRIDQPGSVYSLGYDINQSQSPMTMRFLLSTTESADSPIQGIMSLIVVRK
jgi:hypothetical protein